MYRIYHLNREVKTFTTRDAALDWIVDQVESNPRTDFGDYEILDNADT